MWYSLCKSMIQKWCYCFLLDKIATIKAAESFMSIYFNLHSMKVKNHCCWCCDSEIFTNLVVLFMDMPRITGEYVTVWTTCAVRSTVTIELRRMESWFSELATRFVVQRTAMWACMRNLKAESDSCMKMELGNMITNNSKCQTNLYTILKRSRDFLLCTKKETNCVLFIR